MTAVWKSKVNVNGEEFSQRYKEMSAVVEHLHETLVKVYNLVTWYIIAMWY
jgi:hypothetical protein